MVGGLGVVGWEIPEGGGGAGGVELGQVLEVGRAAFGEVMDWVFVRRWRGRFGGDVMLDGVGRVWTCKGAVERRCRGGCVGHSMDKVILDMCGKGECRWKRRVVLLGWRRGGILMIQG